MEQMNVDVLVLVFIDSRIKMVQWYATKNTSRESKKKNPSVMLLTYIITQHWCACVIIVRSKTRKTYSRSKVWSFIIIDVETLMFLG